MTGTRDYTQIEEQLSDIQKILDDIANKKEYGEAEIKEPVEQQEFELSDEEIARIINTHERFWKQSFNNKLPQKFYDTNWKCYTRTDPDATPNATWGILVSHVQIGKAVPNGYTTILLHVHYVTGKIKHTGIITYDADGKYLVAFLTKQKDGNNKLETPSIFILQVRDPKDQTLLVGLFTNYSSFFLRFATKRVLWVETNENIKVQDLANTNKEFAKIDVNIRRFLRERSQNLLSLPSISLSNLNDNNDLERSLYGWLNPAFKAVHNDKILQACVGKYYIFYIDDDLDKEENINTVSDFNKHLYRYIRIAELEIIYNDDSPIFEAKYVHYINESSNNKLKHSFDMYVGKAIHRNYTIQITASYFEGEPSSDKFFLMPNSRNSILITFNTPKCDENRAREEFNNHDYFEGIIAGMSDSKNNPICYKSAIVRKSHLRGKKIKLNGSSTFNSIIEENSDYFFQKISQYFFRNLGKYKIVISNY